MLLEAMQERQITIGDQSFKLEEPFLVIKHSKPGRTRRNLPSSRKLQVDRFMLKVMIDYPKKEEEKLIMRHNLAKEFPQAKNILKTESIVSAREVVKEVYMDEKIEQYILDIIFTRNPEKNGLEKIKDFISFGGSQEASINLAKASKKFAFIKRRGYVIPEDVSLMCYDVLRHRIGLTYESRN